MKEHITYVLVCIVLLITAFYMMRYPTYLNRKSLLSVLKDTDYLNTLKQTDLSVRNVKSVDEYVDKMIRPSVSNPNFLEKMRLYWLTTLVDMKVVLQFKKTSYFNPKKLAIIPWKIGIVDGLLYEEGLSHTRNGVIILSRETLQTSSNNELLKTLLHEKVHVYQFLYKDDIQNYLSSKGMKIIGKRSAKIRANPDTDEHIYMDSSGTRYMATYTSNPTSISDVNYAVGTSQFYEHPFESMAIEIQNKLK